MIKNKKIKTNLRGNSCPYFSCIW